MPINSFTPTTGYARFSTLVYPVFTVASDATAAAVTYTTTQVLGGLILRNTSGAARADLLPTVASLVQAIEGIQVGTGFEFVVRSAGAETITVTTNTGWTLSGTMTIATLNSKRFMVVFTNITPGTEAATLYSLGTSVF